jgi:hypothetical protein
MYLVKIYYAAGIISSGEQHHKMIFPNVIGAKTREISKQTGRKEKARIQKTEKGKRRRIT